MGRVVRQVEPALEREQHIGGVHQACLAGANQSGNLTVVDRCALELSDLDQIFELTGGHRRCLTRRAVAR